MAEVATLPLLLKQLRLPMMYAQWQNKSDEANKYHWTYPQYLSVLSEVELAARTQKKIQRHIKESKLPQGKALETFNFKITKSINAAQIRAFGENISWIKQAENLIIFGPSGVGKTHLAAAIGYRLIEQGIRVLFSATTTLVQKLQYARSQHKLPEMLAKLSNYHLLILDDVSYVKRTELETSVLFELIADRYEANSLMITANQAFGEWGQIFPDNTMAVAAIDRLVHHATIINIEEQSYRQAKSSKN